jgi:hypothetical protein
MSPISKDGAKPLANLSLGGDRDIELVAVRISHEWDQVVDPSWCTTTARRLTRLSIGGLPSRYGGLPSRFAVPLVAGRPVYLDRRRAEHGPC